MSRLLLVLTVLAAISCASEAKAQHRHRAGYQPLGAVSDPFGAVRGVYGLERAASRNTWPVSGPYVYPMTPSYFPPAYRYGYGGYGGGYGANYGYRYGGYGAAY